MIRSLLARLYGGMVKLVGALTLLRIVLLWLALISLGYGLISLVQQLQDTWILWTAFTGVLLGWLLSRSRLSGLWFALLALIIGLGWLILTVGQVSIPLATFLLVWLKIYVQIASHHMAIPAAQLGAFSEAWKSLLIGLLNLYSRLGNWFKGTASSLIIVDPMITTILWGAAVWLASVWAAWFVRRRGNAILGLLPAMSLLAYNTYYVNSKSGATWLVLLGGSMLLLQAANGYRSAHNRWLAFHFDRTELEPILITAVLGICAVLMLAGTLSPSISVKDIRDTVQHILEARRNEELARSLGLEQTQEAVGGISHGPIGPIPLTSLHMVGPGPKLSQDVVMYVAVEDYIPPPPNVPNSNPGLAGFPAFYWRSQTYDRYTSNGWVTSTTSDTDYQANQPLLAGLTDPLPDHYRLFHENVQRLGASGGALFVSGELITADQSYRASWRDTGDLVGAETSTDSYTVESRMQYLTADQLRAAGKDYPAPILGRYLQLPSSVPPRVRNLALSLTTAQATPFDQINALQTYLRAFPYSLDVPGPPPGRDVADFFLFDLKKGYCDYYATSLVVMARAVGIPARVVIGYSSGTFDYQNRRFVVTAANSHAWAEVYFPGLGWVEFEPTANLPAIEHPGGAVKPSTIAPSTPPAKPGLKVSPIVINAAFLRRLAQGFAVLLAILLVYLLLPVERLSLLLRPADRAVTTIYHRLYHQGSRWGIETRAARTPYEFVSELSALLVGKYKEKRLPSAVTAIRTDLDWLTDLYTRLLFSPDPPTRLEHHQAIQTWFRLRRRLTWVRVGNMIAFRK